MELDVNAFEVWVRQWGAAAAIANARNEGHTIAEVRAAIDGFAKREADKARAFQAECAKALEA